MWHILCDVRPFSLIKQTKNILCTVEDDEFNKWDQFLRYTCPNAETEKILMNIRVHTI